MVQQVDEFEVELSANALAELDGLAYGQIHVPDWEAAQRVARTAVAPDDHRAETLVGRLRVGEHINSRTAAGGVADAAGGTSRNDVGVSRVSARVLVDPDSATAG